MPSSSQPSSTSVFRATVIVALLSGLAAIVAFVVPIVFQRDNSARHEPTSAAANLNDVRRRLGRLELQNRELKAQVETMSRTKVPGQSKLTAELKSAQNTVARMDGQLSELKDAVIDDPTRALRLPLLARDLQATREASQASLSALRQDIDRQYDLMKFVVGTLALSIIGTLVTVWVNLLRSGRGSTQPG
jgi:hypothetical protein